MLLILQWSVCNGIMRGGNMDLPEPTIHSFIVKIWLEEVVDETGNAIWRGHITHVPSGARRYLKELDDIVEFILPYLEAMGVRSSRWMLARRWLRKRRFFQFKRCWNDLRNNNPQQGGRS